MSVNDSAGLFSSQQLRKRIGDLPPAHQYWVGFSGGADSTALLLALCHCRESLNAPFQAIHFHHGLNPDANSWLDHCRAFCTQRDIPFSSQILKLPTDGSTSTEEAARNARYQAMSELLGCNDIYFTAHHANDQAETVFMNLIRGAGIEGLAGIPELRTLGLGQVARPLLDWRRSDLENYLSRHGVEWLEDPSNRDESFDRNFLRNHLFPLIEARWPGLVKNLNRSAANAKVASEALTGFIHYNSAELLDNKHRLPLIPFLQLETSMQTLVLRQWLRRGKVPALSHQRLHEFLSQVVGAGRSSQAEVRWDHWLLKLHGRSIWLQDSSRVVSCGSYAWSKGMALELGDGLGTLKLQGAATELPPGWQVSARADGEKIRLHQTGGRTTLKDLYRQSGIPPWLRSAIPVLRWDGEAVAIGDWLLSEKMQTWLNSRALDYRWHPTDALLKELQSISHHLAVDR